jgi:hypothetical protein
MNGKNKFRYRYENETLVRHDHCFVSRSELYIQELVKPFQHFCEDLWRCTLFKKDKTI